MGIGPGPPAPHHGPAHVPRWQRRCWRRCASRWASRTPRRCRNLPSSSSKGKVSSSTWQKGARPGPPCAHGRAVPTPGPAGLRRAGLEWQGRPPTGAPLAGKLVRPLRPHEYLNNAARDQDASLHSRRLSWETPLHFDNPTYVSTHYSQVGQSHSALARECQLTLPAWEASQPPSPQGKGMGAGTGGSRVQLPIAARPAGAAGLPAGEAARRHPGRRPGCPAGRPAAPQQGPRGAPVRVSVGAAPASRHSSGPTQGPLLQPIVQGQGHSALTR